MRAGLMTLAFAVIAVSGCQKQGYGQHETYQVPDKAPAQREPSALVRVGTASSEDMVIGIGANSIVAGGNDFGVQYRIGEVHLRGAVDLPVTDWADQVKAARANTRGGDMVLVTVSGCRQRQAKPGKADPNTVALYCRVPTAQGEVTIAGQGARIANDLRALAASHTRASLMGIVWMINGEPILLIH